MSRCSTARCVLSAVSRARMERSSCACEVCRDTRSCRSAAAAAAATSRRSRRRALRPREAVWIVTAAPCRRKPCQPGKPGAEVRAWEDAAVGAMGTAAAAARAAAARVAAA
eukprot:scaffold50768_cov54-Phaeocystis_antarctica.AAC.2